MKKLLFQGSCPNRCTSNIEKEICRVIARQAHTNNWKLVFGGYTPYEQEIASELLMLCNNNRIETERYLSWYMCFGENIDVPVKAGHRYDLDGMTIHNSHGSLRTFLVSQSDALITLGGKKGVRDSVEKSYLSGKPFFTIPLANGESRILWNLYCKTELPFCEQKDFLLLGNQFRTPHEIVEHIFSCLNTYWNPAQTQTFIVHGHDNDEKYILKDYLQNRLSLPEPVILKDKADSGLTIIEKFERYSKSINLVFVILTPDDLVVPSGSDAEAIYRSRQNVIFELGYFLGRLGRKTGRVILLHKGPIDIPSDLSGVIYIDISKGLEMAYDRIRSEIDLQQDDNE